MRFLKRALPHLTLVLGLMTLTFFAIDRVNAGMAFMTSELSKWVFAALALCAILTSVCLVGSNWRDEARALRKRHKTRARAESPLPPHADSAESDLQETQE